MSFLAGLRAVVCQLRASAVAPIAIAACGGTVESTSSPSADGGASGTDASVGCPNLSDIDDGAALGRACSSEGLYCTNVECDACTEACPAVACTHGEWSAAVNTAHCIGDAGVTSTPDASADASECMAIGPAGFDEACGSDTDCVAVQAGEICSNGESCICLAASIDTSGEASYDSMVQQALMNVPPSAHPGCSCPYFGAPKCLGGMCTLCGGASQHAGCPDGG
jgi:hypothetical protein